MMSAEGAAQAILQIAFSATPMGLTLFLNPTLGSRPGLFSDLSMTCFATETR